MGDRTRRNLYQAFVGEAKAHFRGYAVQIPYNFNDRR